MKKFVYYFGASGSEGDGKMKDILGGKGAGLAEMSRAGLPVPPGFTISTEVCNAYFQNGNRTPDEVQMRLQRNPRPPAPALFVTLSAPRIPDRWQPYLTAFA